MRSRLALLDTSGIAWSAILTASECLSHTELVRACEQAAKNTILQHHTALETETLVASLNERRSTHAFRAPS
jgi:hypothetical protein